jgi:hypothetical protein
MAKDKKKAKPIPKQVAGVKVPKKLRKLGNNAAKIVKDPLLSEAAAGALLAAAAALQEGPKVKRAAGEAAGAAGDAAGEAKREAGRLGAALKALALDLARRTLDNLEEKKGGRRGGGGKDEPSGE